MNREKHKKWLTSDHTADRQTEDTQGKRCPLPSQHKHISDSFVFTFLQALMDEATVLSVLPPSPSTDSEPSNMADDWKLLQGNKGTELTLSEQVLFSCSTLPFRKSLQSVRTGYLRSDWNSPLPVTFVHTVHLWHSISELTRQLLSELFHYPELKI